MRVSRRSVVAGSTVVAACALTTGSMSAPREPTETDYELADLLIRTMPSQGYFEILKHLSQITVRGSTGESFSSRWRRGSNPLIMRFYQDLGYHGPSFDECSPWCAVALAWCLQRDGRPLPPDPARSQNYLTYGTPVTSPERGDICIFTDVDNAANGHVGLFAGFADGDRIWLLGGNQKGDDEATSCGRNFPKSYIDTHPVSINAERARTANGLYLNQYRRPPGRRDGQVFALETDAPPAHAAASGVRTSAASGNLLDARLWTEGHLDLAALGAALPSGAALPPLLGHAAGGVLVGALGLGLAASGQQTRQARAVHLQQSEAQARRSLAVVERLAPGAAASSVNADSPDRFGARVKAFALYLAREIKQKPIASLRKARLPAAIQLELDSLEASVPAIYEVVSRFLALKLALVRWSNYVSTRTDRSPEYRAIYDGEVTPALRDLLAVLPVALSAEDQQLVLETPVHRRTTWFRMLRPSGRGAKAAPAEAS